MRQQLLAHEMERTQELGAEIVSLLHIAPAHNTDFQRVTSPTLRTLGDSVMEVWRRLQRYSNRFTSISTEELFNKFAAERSSELAAWWEYITARFSWLQE